MAFDAMNWVFFGLLVTSPLARRRRAKHKWIVYKEKHIRKTVLKKKKKLKKLKEKEVFFYKTNSAEDSWRTKNNNDF